ncbi:unnamed protein product, partial [Polarella glacialis]
EYCTDMRHFVLLRSRGCGLGSLLRAASTGSVMMAAVSATGMPAGSPATTSSPSRTHPEGKGLGKGRRAEESREVQISKILSQLLRHRANSLKLDIRPDGFIGLDAVLNCSVLSNAGRVMVGELRFAATLKEIQKIVEESDKKRFSLTKVDGTWHIRANQGHSMKE